MPVSSSSYSGCSLERRPFSSIRSSYGKRRLGVVVAPAEPRAAGQRVEVPPVLLDVLAVVALAVGQPEHPLLEDGVAAVPQREPEVEPPEQVRDAGHPVLVPAVRARARVVVRERGPGVAARRCSPRGPSPRPAPRRTGPTGTTGWPSPAPPRGGPRAPSAAARCRPGPPGSPARGTARRIPCRSSSAGRRGRTRRPQGRQHDHRPRSGAIAAALDRAGRRPPRTGRPGWPGWCRRSVARVPCRPPRAAPRSRAPPSTR